MFLTYTAIAATYIPHLVELVGDLAKKNQAGNRAAVVKVHQPNKPIAIAKAPQPDKSAVAGKEQQPAKPIAVGKDQQPEKSAVAAKAQQPDKPAVAGKDQPEKPAAANMQQPDKPAVAAKTQQPEKPAVAGKAQPPEKPAVAKAGDAEDDDGDDTDDDMAPIDLRKPPSLLEAMVLVVPLLIVYLYAVPILVGFESPMALVIVGIGLYEAWVINRRSPLVINGPYRIRRPGAGSTQYAGPAS